jgi:hypothetical protein
MSNTNTGGPAYPAPTTKPLENYYPGMTLRDYFAAKAMQGMMTSARYTGIIGVNNYEHSIANQAYQMADAMLKAREA